MTHETKHTPTPWALVPQSDGSAMLAREYETGQQMNPKGLRLIAHVLARGNTLSEDEANAEFIVRAVNAHDGLLELAAEAMWGRDYPQGGSIYKTYESLSYQDKEIHRKEALAKARGEA